MVSKLKPTFVTDEFISAVADSLATGNAITLTTAVASATTYTDTQLSGLNYAGSQSATKNLTTDLNSAVVKADTNTIVIDVDLVNQNLNADFQISTVLINGTYKGANILVGVVRFETPELFPAYDNISIYELEMKLYISVSRIADAKINVNSAGMATAKSVQDLRTYVDGDFNADIARKTKDNIFTGTNTFNKKIIAPAGVQGNADTATKLQTARRINGTLFDGTADINVNAANDSNLVHRTGNENIAGIKSFSDVLRVGLGSFNGGVLEISNAIPYIDFHFGNDTGDYTSRIIEEASGTLNVNGVRMKSGVITGSLTGNADTTTKLQTARLVGGVSFDGTSDIVLPGVNAKGNQDTSGRAANATNADRANSSASADIANKAVALNTPRKINGTNFDGTADINVPASNDGDIVHKSGNETVNGDKTFTGNSIFTKPIDGALTTRLATFKDFATVAANMTAYAGHWYVDDKPIANYVNSTAVWYLVEVIPGNGDKTGVIRTMPFGSQVIYYAGVINGILGGWKRLSDDATVVHNTGNETLSGVKTFNDRSVFNKPIRGTLDWIYSTEKDLNNITTSGQYKIDTSFTNVPTSLPNGSFLYVNNFDDNLIYQTIIARQITDTLKKATIWTRLHIQGAWGDWQSIAKDDDILHLSGDETAAGFKKFSGNIATTSDNSMINGGGNNGDIALVKKNGGSGFIGIGSAQLGNTFRIKRSNNSSINPSDTFTDMFTVDINGVVKAGTQQDLVPLDKNVVHNTGAETIAGAKRFTEAITADVAINGMLATRNDLPSDFNTMNTYSATGIYGVGATNLTNQPVAKFGILQNIVLPSGTTYQKYIDIESGDVYSRAYISTKGSWSAWDKNADDATVVHNTGKEDIFGMKSLRNGAAIYEGLEIFNQTPFIDFHFNNGTEDYTSRIIETTKGTLSINGINMSGGTISGALNGNASSATKLATSRNINGVAFDGTSDITIDPATRVIGTATDLFTLANGFYYNAGVASTNKPAAASIYFVVEVIQTSTNGFMRLVDSNGLSFWTTKSASAWGAWHQDADDATVVHNSGNETIGGSKTFSSTINGNLNGNSTTATKLQTARTIGGVSFDGSTNINLPGVNTTGNQNTTGNAATATKLQFARKINGVSFDGSGDISVNAANDDNLVHKDNTETLSGNKTFSGVATFSKAQTSSTIKKTITTNAPISLNFAETAFGVMVYASASGTFTADSTWKTLATLPTEISAPVQTVTLNDVDWAGIPNVSYRIGVGLKIAIKPNREITYKVTSLKENDNASYNVGTTFDTSTYWSK